MDRIARVFVRRTQYTPTDELCFFGPPGLLAPDVDEVHVSCLFTWDRPKVDSLARSWARVAPVKVGGPAYGKAGGGGGEFTPGLYLRENYVITSRGCPRKCPFCFVHEQEGDLHELKKIHVGSWVMDNNLLACSDAHVSKVFDMLEGRKDVKFLGGLDVRFLKGWHAERLAKLALSNVSIAYDMPGVEPHLERGLRLLHGAGVGHGVIRCFVLAGYFDWDTPDKAEGRCREVLRLGATPCAMFYRGPDEANPRKPVEWSKWAVRWSWQPGVYAMAKREGLLTYQNLEGKRGESKR